MRNTAIIYISQIDNFSKEYKLNNIQWYNYLNKISDEKRYFQSFFSRILLEKLLYDYNIKTSNLLRKDNGYTYLENSNIYISISHSNNYISASISSKPIGIDIESSSNNRDIFNISSEKEIKKYNYKKYLDVWTLKESYIKCYNISNIFQMKNIYLKKHKKYYKIKNKKGYLYNTNYYTFSVFTQSKKIIIKEI